jgi:hypothetical protein
VVSEPEFRFELLDVHAPAIGDASPLRFPELAGCLPAALAKLLTAPEPA